MDSVRVPVWHEGVDNLDESLFFKGLEILLIVVRAYLPHLPRR